MVRHRLRGARRGRVRQPAPAAALRQGSGRLHRPKRRRTGRRQHDRPQRGRRRRDHRVRKRFLQRHPRHGRQVAHGQRRRQRPDHPGGRGGRTWVNLGAITSPTPTITYAGSGRDSIVLPGQGVHVVFAGAGDDTITAESGATGTYIVFGEEGTDSVDIEGGNVIYLGDDDFGGARPVQGGILERHGHGRPDPELLRARQRWHAAGRRAGGVLHGARRCGRIRQPCGPVAALHRAHAGQRREGRRDHLRRRGQPRHFSPARATTASPRAMVRLRARCASSRATDRTRSSRAAPMPSSRPGPIAISSS